MICFSPLELLLPLPLEDELNSSRFLLLVVLLCCSPVPEPGLVVTLCIAACLLVASHALFSPSFNSWLARLDFGGSSALND